ncbi:zinc finger and BTB domain-containing protein 5 [Grus japonensis]|uniref:Zinc finger and BTB domain-containing protein 5 n=1 Tax=Grus japonensis TaxID=30415 RepID=A0ABC9Y3F9_GRUJA
MEVDSGANICLQPVEDSMLEPVRAPERDCDPMGSLRWSRLLAGPVICWGPMLEQSGPEGLHPVEGTHAGAVGEELQPMGRTHIGEIGGGLSPVGGTPRWSRGRV